MTWENASERRLSRSELAARAASRPARSQICAIASRKRGGTISAPASRPLAPPPRLASRPLARPALFGPLRPPAPRFCAPAPRLRASRPLHPGSSRLAPRPLCPIPWPRVLPPEPWPLAPCVPTPRARPSGSRPDPATRSPAPVATFSRRNGTNRQFGTVGSATVGRFGGRRPHVLGVFPGRLRTARRPWRRAPYQTAD